jgi:hypothetical protein
VAQKIQTIVSTVDDLDESRVATNDLDESRVATKRRVFGVGKRRYAIDLCDENAERFDQQMSYWVKAARRIKDQDREPSSPVPSSHLETIVPVPVKGQPWWMDPPRPLSRATTEKFTSARRRVREWARKNGWPNLGERGAVPHRAYDLWFDEVWSRMENPSWEALEQAEADSRRSSKPRRGEKK